MARVHYVGANGEEPPLTELEQEKLKGQQIANDISQTKLRRLRAVLLEKREVKFVTETMAVVLRQELMRLPSQAVADLRGQSLTHEQLFSIRMSVDKTVRSALAKAADTLRRALNPREAMAELVGEEHPSQKDLDAAARKRLGSTRSAARCEERRHESNPN